MNDNVNKINEAVSSIALEQAITVISNNNDLKLLKRVPEQHLFGTASEGSKLFKAAIIDLETLGLDPKAHPIIEIGFLLFSFTSEEGIIEIIETYNGLQDPGMPIPTEITKITGITDNDVAGKTIDWELVGRLLQETDLVICHNASFDRNHLELQSPPFIQDIVKNMAFGCSLKDVDWRQRGYESTKLEFLNFKAGFFYEGHRALVDCWATLNILAVEPSSFDELKTNVRKRDVLICALNSSFDTKDLLKARGYRWSDGTAALPKAWWTTIEESAFNEEKAWLDEIIYKSQSASSALPSRVITARTRYSRRAEILD
ncbi:MAG: DNA polymerase III subunit epsilon [Moraxellaceae bacterium]|nr:MAG: DNA polymerase III subunit epsilon [Moraxellaceae bacterium]